ncbi:MAG: type II toxin-antitoxin system HigB family toxin [Gammaproteobacteria bacterium]|nr:type II toxin-antitoxin system HigB family toxin [Gammaproteobacteria bacterium]
MVVVASDRVKEAQLRYPGADHYLQGWYQILSKGSFKSEAALKVVFGDIRGFSHQYRFPIPESTLLVHTLINFESQVALIEEIKPGNH